MLYERVFKLFYDTRLEYAVIGGIAVNLHGYSRLTGDLDIIVEMSDEGLSKFVDCCEQLGLVPRLPVELKELAVEKSREEWISDKGMMVFSVYNPKMPLEHIDVKIDEPQKVESWLTKSVKLPVDDFEISVLCFEDLLQMKRSAGRERDLLDVRALEKIKELK